MTELKCPKCRETEAIYYYFAEKCGIKCGTCGYEIRDCESEEEAEFKWKSGNDPKALRSCPCCGSTKIHVVAPDDGCYCWDCGLTMPNRPNWRERWNRRVL